MAECPCCIANHPSLRIEPMLPIGTRYKSVSPHRLMGLELFFETILFWETPSSQVVHLKRVFKTVIKFDSTVEPCGIGVLLGSNTAPFRTVLKPVKPL